MARGPRERKGALVEALIRELGLRAALLDETFDRQERPSLGSVYLGGGTPSLLAPDQVAAVLQAADRHLGLAPDAEISLEANPGPDELGDLGGFRAAGVTRLSIGAQSMDRVELRRLGRRHDEGDVERAVGAARKAGFRSVSLDLLTDIPGQSMASWRATLAAALDLAPDHLSVYTLSLDDPDAAGLTGPNGDHLPVSRGARRWRSRARTEQSEARAAGMELLVDELAPAAGLVRYEIANLARPGHGCRHNRLYWRRRAHLAIGPGAHAFDGSLRRSWNAARLDGYLAALDAGRLPPGGEEQVDIPTAIAEAAILGLRLTEGIDAALALVPGLAIGLNWGREHGLLEERLGRTRLTGPGRLLANEVFARLLPEAGAPRLLPDAGARDAGAREAGAARAGSVASR